MVRPSVFVLSLSKLKKGVVNESRNVVNFEFYTKRNSTSQFLNFKYDLYIMKII